MFAVPRLVLFRTSTGPLVRAQSATVSGCQDRRVGDVPRRRKREAGGDEVMSARGCDEGFCGICGSALVGDAQWLCL